MCFVNKMNSADGRVNHSQWTHTHLSTKQFDNKHLAFDSNELLISYENAMRFIAVLGFPDNKF